MNTNENVDKEYVEELVLFAENDGYIYESCGLPCIKNLQRKIKRGVFDETKAPRLFELRYLDLARERYEKDFGSGSKPRMNKAEKELFGKMAYESFKEQIKEIES